MLLGLIQSSRPYHVATKLVIINSFSLFLIGCTALKLDMVESSTLWHLRHSLLVQMSRLMSKPTDVHQVRLRSPGRPPSLIESSLCTQWVAKDPSFLHADSEDSDQTGRMPRLI